MPDMTSYAHFGRTVANEVLSEEERATLAGEVDWERYGYACSEAVGKAGKEKRPVIFPDPKDYIIPGAAPAAVQTRQAAAPIPPTSSWRVLQGQAAGAVVGPGAAATALTFRSYAQLNEARKRGDLTRNEWRWYMGLGPKHWWQR